MLKSFSRDAIIYGLGNIIAKAINFLVLPIYTHIFSPSEFGLLELVLVLNGVYGAIILLGLDSAQSIYFHKHKDAGFEAQKEIITSVLQLRIVWGTLITLVFAITLPLWVLLFSLGDLSKSFLILALLGTFLSQISSQGIDIFRLIFRPIPCVTLSAFQSILNVSCILFLITYFEYGVGGFFLGSFIGASICVLTTWFITRKYISPVKIHTKHWGMLVKFGIPLIPEALLLHAMLIMDRLFLQSYHGPLAVGVYAVAFRFSVIMAAFTEVFRKAWWPYALKFMYQPGGERLFRFMAQLYISTMCAFILLLTILSPFMIKYLTGPEYASASMLIGLLCWQSLFNGFILIGSAGIWKEQKTSYSFYVTGIALIFGVCFNFLLVPRYGMFGAAIATAISYFIWAFLSLEVSERLWSINFPKLRIFLDITVAGCGMVVFMTQFGEHQFVASSVVTVLAIYFIVKSYLIILKEKPFNENPA